MKLKKEEEEEEGEGEAEDDVVRFQHVGKTSPSSPLSSLSPLHLPPLLASPPPPLPPFLSSLPAPQHSPLQKSAGVEEGEGF